MTTASVPSRSRIQLLHGVSACVLAGFVAVHLLNHALLAADIAMAFAFMERFRLVYRWPPVEVLILACALVQLATGPMLARTGPRAARSSMATRLTGYYLAFFILVHLGAVFWGRRAGFDTNIYFAAAGLHAWPAAAFFAPYYFFAVLAVIVHLGLAAMRRSRPASPQPAGAALVVCTIAGVVVGTVIVASMAGLGSGLAIPPDYLRAVQR